MRFSVFFISLVFSITYSSAQNYSRIRADYTIKEKAESYSSLSKGTAYYDKFNKKLVYDTSFPEKEIWVLKDTSVIKLIEGKVAERIVAPAIPEFSIYHIALNGNLLNYGLKDSYYKLHKVEKEGDLIIATWKPDEKLSNIMGNVIISSKNKILQAIIIYNTKGEIISKQNYKSHININGLIFPTEIIEVVYTPEGNKYKQTLYTNIKVNELINEKMYNYPVTF
ncbi:MAG: hypothetical protein M3Q58_14930 [Bacteroidota bacterium]|nr:hypothetical protein [Bacteroidota bacterium]